MLSNWGGNVRFSAADQARPGTMEELQELVARTPRIRAVGTRHSFSTIADTVGTMVSTQGLEQSIEIDEQAHVVVVPAGATFAEIARALHAQGWALHNLGSLPHISVAGACATGTHGSGNTLGNLSTAAVGVEFVRSDGELVRSARGEPDFPGMVLALGCLGVVTRLWLRIEPTFEVSQRVFTSTPTRTVVDRIDEIFAAAYSVSVFSSYQDPRVVDMIWFKARVDAGEGTELEALVGGSAATKDLNPVAGQDPRAATEQRGVPGPWHERLPHFRSGFTPSSGHEIQSEFLLPRSTSAEVLVALHAIAADVAHALQVFEMRTIAADDLWLSPSYDRDSVAAHFTWHPAPDLVGPALQRVQEALSPFHPRPHWGKVFSGWRGEEIEASYPQLPRFRELRNALDPERHFGNAFLDPLLGG